MRLVDVRIRNFRSIAEEQAVPVGRAVTIVGPNNSGKTNVLRAVRILFTGHDNRLAYVREKDLFEGAGRERTTITAKFSGDPAGADKWFYDELDVLHKLQGTRRSGDEVSLHLYFTESGTPVYNFFPNVKRPVERNKAVKYSKVARDLVSKFIDSFSVHYVPSDKSIETLYKDLITPFLRRSVSEVLDSYRDELQSKLDEAGVDVTSQMETAGCGGVNAKFAVPDGSISSLLSHFDFRLSDPLETEYLQKGMGIQAAAVFATLSWITEQELASGRSVIWLIEEPESYLHPSLSAACFRLLRDLGEKASVFMTTHSLAFVPSDPFLIRGAERKKGRTSLISYRTSFDAGQSIRKSLGVKFGDYYGLGRANVFVEGPSDREALQWVLSRLPQNSYPLQTLRNAIVQDFGGVRHLAGFLRATYALFSNEVASVAMFDGDDAGNKERKDLQQYFGQKQIQFRSNHEFVSVRDRFAIEGLFPDNWVIHLHDQRPAWFESYSVDVSGNLEPFRVKDARKADVMATFMAWAEDENDLTWAGRFVSLVEAINASLESQVKKLES